MSLSEPTAAERPARPVDPIAQHLQALAEAAKRRGDRDRYWQLRRELLQHQAATYVRRPRVRPCVRPAAPSHGEA